MPIAEKNDTQEFDTSSDFSNDKSKGSELTTIAVRQLQTSTAYKAERMAKIRKYEELYQGNVPRKFRQLFNVNFPVFTSFVDTLMSDFDDTITAHFKEEDPSDYFGVKKIQAAWDRQKMSMKPSGRWDLKIRLDRKNAIMSGRGILKYYATSEPEYESHFDVVNYNYFHCQPTGGADLENHLFCGEEMIQKTETDLWDGVDAGIYDEDQVEKLLAAYGNKDFVKDLSSDDQAKFRALGLDPNSNNYVGETTVSLAQWCMEHNGVRWYLLFDPFTKVWIRVDKLEDVYSGNYYPYVSWATHEDQQVFWSVGYADFFYPVADAIITMVNQELTSRERQNNRPLIYDETMFEDEAALDEMTYRPDAQVPANTRGGTRKITDGFYQFNVGQVQGTVDVVNWMYDQTSRFAGSSDQMQGAPPKGGDKKAYVQFMQQQQISKRLSYKAQSYQECYQQIAIRFINGLVDNMPPEMAIKLVGPEGYDHWDYIRRIDLKFRQMPSIEIRSTTAQENADKMKSDSQMAALAEITKNPNLIPFFNMRTVGEYLARRGGHFDDSDIAVLMDVNSSVDKEVQAKAAIAIKDLMERKEPDVNYSADIVFMKLIQKFLVDHLELIDKRGIKKKFTDYIIKHTKIVKDNMDRKAKEIQLERQNMAMDKTDGGGQQQQSGQGQGQPQPQQKQPMKAGRPNPIQKRPMNTAQKVNLKAPQPTQ